MPANQTAEDRTGMYTTEDWQAQLEELLALQSIFAEDFRVTHIPGHSQDDNTANTTNEQGGSRNSTSRDSSSRDSSTGDGHHDVGEHLESLIGSMPPAVADGLLTCEAIVQVELPSGKLQIVLDMQQQQQQPSMQGDGLPGSSSSSHIEDSASKSSKANSRSSTMLMPIGSPISWLPPVYVQLTLPYMYPSSDSAPPKVVMQACWLSGQQAELLQQHLQQLWKEQGPGPICFAWLDFLKNDALQALGVDDELVLQPQASQQQQQRDTGQLQQLGLKQGQQTGQQNSSQQQQHQQQLSTMEDTAVQLLRYSTAQEAQVFKESMQTCSICFEQVLGSDCMRLPECGHFYCTACLRAHAAAQMEQGAVENLRCPEPSCRRAFQPYVIQELLGDEQYARWEKLLLQRTLDKMEDVVYCPRCDTVCIEDRDHCAQCSKCLYVFCSFCSDSWHPGTECLDPHERLRILERRKKATGAGDKRHEMDLVNQLMNLKYLNTCSRKCPSCGMATIKNEGCNKMTCVYCGANWCWKCQQVIQGYDHFKDSRCNMFDQEEINRWNAMMWANERAREVEMGQFAMQVRLQQTPSARLCRCPVCGQENLRKGKNNLLRCWSCNCHFCYSCRSWLRGKVGQHFIGPKACKQHGD